MSGTTEQPIFAEEVTLLAEKLAELTERLSKAEADLAAQTAPLDANHAAQDAALAAVSAALAGIKALNFHVLGNDLGAVSKRVESLENIQKAEATELATMIGRVRERLDEAVAATEKKLAQVESTRAEFAQKQDADAKALAQKADRTELQKAVETLAGELESARKQFAAMPAGLNPCGEWKSQQSYDRLDVVSLNGTSYISRSSRNTEKPSKLSAKWQVLARRGSSTNATSLSSIEVVPGYTVNDFRQLDPVISVAKAMNAGSTVAIAEYGDSTTVGYINGSTVGSTPAPSILQSTLRSFFNNASITVYNRGVSATSTTNIISTWDATLAAESATVIILNYGMNDNTSLTHQQFADNLRTLIKGVRNASKLAILKTPNPARAQGTLGGQTKAELVKEFAEVVRQVGRETNTPVIDVYKAVCDRWTAGVNVITDITDGIHPSDTVYQAIGRECAWLFMGHPAAILREKEVIPVSTPVWKVVSQGSTGAVSSLVGIYVTANKIYCAVKVEKPGIDVYLGSAMAAATTTELTVNVDGSTIGTISQYASAHVNAWPCDMDLMLIENAVPGVHFIELLATGSELAIATYIRAWPTRIPGRVLLSKAAGNDLTINYRTSVLPRVTIVSDSTDIKHAITDIPMSCFNRTADIRWKATMPKQTGVVLFGARRSSSAAIRGGVLVFTNTTTGYLAVSEASETGYSAADVIGNADLSGAEHEYRVTVSSAGLMTLYVDGSSIGTHSLVKPYYGGKLAFYTAAAATLDVSEIQIY